MLSYELDWDSDKEKVKLCMSKYIMNAFKRLNYSPLISPQYSPYHHSSFRFPKKGDQQYTTTDDSSPYLLTKQIRWPQSAIGSF